MEGFADSSPILVAVTWLKDAQGAAVEVPLLSGKTFPFGLLAETRGGGGIVTRWFVPWSSVVYVKQVQTAVDSGVGVAAPTVVVQNVAAQPTDKNG